MILSCVVSWAVTGLALAFPANYMEATRGDLPDYGDPLPVLAFDIGINTVSGRLGVYPIRGGSESDFRADFDSFAFTVPAGTELIAAQVAVADVAFSSMGNMKISSWYFRAGSASFAGGTEVQQLRTNSPGTAIVSAVPLGANVYNMSADFLTFDAPTPAASDYAFTFELARVVPEPASLGLALVGGWLLGLSARGPRLFRG